MCEFRMESIYYAMRSAGSVNDCCLLACRRAGSGIGSVALGAAAALAGSIKAVGSAAGGEGHLSTGPGGVEEPDIALPNELGAAVQLLPRVGW